VDGLTPGMLVFMPHSILFDHMFQLPLPIVEKLARPVIVYLVLVLLLRLFGKRELAQLNPFDLVVCFRCQHGAERDHRRRQSVTGE